MLNCGILSNLNLNPMKKLVLVSVFLSIVVGMNAQNWNYAVEKQKKGNVYYKFDSTGYKVFISEDVYEEHFVVDSTGNKIFIGTTEATNDLTTEATNEYDDELIFQKRTLTEINLRLKKKRSIKGIGIAAYFVGAGIATYAASESKEELIYIGAGVNLIGLIMWICSPTQHLAHQALLTDQKITHIKYMKHKYDISLYQPNDKIGLGLCLKF